MSRTQLMIAEQVQHREEEGGDLGFMEFFDWLAETRDSRLSGLLPAARYNAGLAIWQES